ncbi:MAG: sigma-54-dependent Fis family transcriptional regulator [Gallionellales bacterium RIFCSPLOWO2_12_FULL_59_22]|nr:MAG: sigma-54-dependent Fis family transcriptional regulator [Gallionellales bacterium RIFCSPLOWO2_02_FULL_59_110]OGT03928.1 MAG: sigma-54-dependent Fis family transcriptional regulator [Gallionellales bacterium RIFCSPLOWO2_02_58_13]OGT12185.1 MAG: sigma-54-dependent Fis family transcriptional regulator [Gallionellales bacterium RIFCSPLOWO2_12_FULL_59_22]
MTANQRTKSAAVLLVDDEPDILELLELALRKMGLEVDKANNVREALAHLAARRYDLCLTDMRMPDGNGLQVVQHIMQNNLDVPVAVITAHGNMENAVAALKAGAFDYLAKPVSLDQLRALVKSALKLPQAGPSGDKTLLGHSPAMQKARDLIKRVARSEAPVHISGESGSGKELAARLIVQSGARHDQQFVAVNCGAIPDNLMESEFFGCKKGAFTGADKDRDGFFQAAHGGTLFLDEVADLPLDMQVKLLRAIQEKRVRKIGGAGEEELDVRIISATHHDLAEFVRQGKFRQDLYYRLNVIPIQMPALREMREDIPEIAQRILGRLRGSAEVHFAEGALRALQGYSFPGNVRELENVIERALALCAGGVIEEQDLLLVPVEHSQPDNASLSSKYPLPEYLDRIEKQALLEALEQTGFNRTAAAKLLGLTFRTMRYRMERLGIKGPNGTGDAD